MGRISKTFAISLTLLVTMSCLIIFEVQPAKCQTITKPSVPEFTVKYVNNTIVIFIENQPFTPTLLPNGYTTELAYDVHVKNQFTTSPITGNTYLPIQNSSSGSNQTVVTAKPTYWFRIMDKMDITVQAQVGYRTYDNKDHPGWYGFSVLNESDWSPTQTISIPDGAVTISNAPAPSPTVPELPSAAAFSLFLVIPLITILIKKRMRPKAYD